MTFFLMVFFFFLLGYNVTPAIFIFGKFVLLYTIMSCSVIIKGGLG